MLDINFLRENSKLVKENIKKRGEKYNSGLVDDVLQLDKEWRELKGKTDELRHERNKITIEITKLSKEKKDISLLVKKARSLPDEIKTNEQRIETLRNSIDNIMLQIPNMMLGDVPIGKDGNDNVVVKKWGKIKKAKFELKNHAELLESFGCADFDMGISNAGKGFNYLKGEIALLDLALQRYGVEFLLKNGFTPVVPPMMLNKETLLGALNGLKDFEDVVYKVDNQDLYLIGTAEHSLVSMLKNKLLNVDELPKKFFAVTPCFRKEIGGHGIDMKWLFRMHQFNKVEQVVFSKPGDSLKILKYMQGLTEKFFQSLGIPYRVIEICSGDLGAKFAKQWDIEAWFPRQNEYREVTSAGSCTNYQSVALNIKYLDQDKKDYLHILNNTMVATSRAMVAILENCQQKDGSVVVPKVLIKYMNGVKIIGKVGKKVNKTKVIKKK